MMAAAVLAPPCTSSARSSPSGNVSSSRDRPRPQAPRPLLRAVAVERDSQIERARVVEWEGLSTWRQAGIDRRRAWGPGDRRSLPTVPAPSTPPSPSPPPPPSSLINAAIRVLQTPSPELKAKLIHQAWVAYNESLLPLFPPSWDEQQQQEQQQPAAPPPPLPERPARPPKPLLVETPREVPTPEQAGVSQNAHLLLNVAHVELNAIDLAADTVARFAALRLPKRFYEDFFRVADDESRHLTWCLQRLRELGVEYGDVPAHDGLWRGCAASSGDLTARLVVVPCGQESRGLDAGQRLAQRLVGLGDARSAAVVARIAEEERAHVAVGVAWFERVCASLDPAADPAAEFRARLLACGCADLATKRSTFNHEERQRVGLQRAWYDATEWGGKGSSSASLPAIDAEATDAGLVQDLRERLAAMVEMEAEAAGGGGGGEGPG